MSADTGGTLPSAALSQPTRYDPSGVILSAQVQLLRVTLRRAVTSWEFCLARIRTYGSGSEHQALTSPNAQIDALKLRRSAELIEVFRGWWRLPEPLKAAVLAIIRTNNTER